MTPWITITATTSATPKAIDSAVSEEASARC
jgi:hypothetical protein